MFNVYITLRVDYNGVVFSLCHFFPTSTLMCCQGSHKKCIEDAIKNNYKHILILEDDALLKFESNSIDDLFDNKKIPDDWDFIYLGKKEGLDVKLLENNYINDEIYIPGELTWASHAWLIKNSIFNSLNDIYNGDIDNPIDILVKKLYDKYNFYCLKNDLFISKLDDSDIRTNIEKPEVWKWNVNNFFSPNISIVRNVYVWGFTHSNTDNSHTHSYIHESIYKSFKKYFPYLNVLWVKNEYDTNVDYNNSLFFVSPTHGDYDELPLCHNSYYIFHIDNFDDNLGLNLNTFKNTKYYELIRSKKAIILECRERGENNYNSHYVEESIMILNWGVEYDFNLISSILNNRIDFFNKINNYKYFAYHGSVWYLNIDEIIKLSNTCEENKLPLLISGRNKYMFGDNLFKGNKYTTTEDFWKLKKPNTIDTTLRSVIYRSIYIYICIYIIFLIRAVKVKGKVKVKVNGFLCL